MNPVWQETVWTGAVATDQEALNQLQARAAQQGLVLGVVNLPHGGLQVSAFPREAPATAMNPYAPPALATAAAPAAAMGAGGAHCQLCGRHAPTKQVTFMQNIGVIVMRFPKTLRGELCRICIGKTFQSYTLTTLFLGWWGVISFFYSLVSIPVNIVTYLAARSLPSDFEPQGAGTPPTS